jgi:NAD(P)-dependent dehydrogenase (short-subunit alcohol dehydrogenase family)
VSVLVLKAISRSRRFIRPAEMIALGEKTFGSVDVLVNNAGIRAGRD